MIKSIDKWLPGYLASILRRPRGGSGVRHLIVCVCDHFEPFRDGASADTARSIVADWLGAYPDTLAGFQDADGCPPRHTFFYPQEEYDEVILDRLAAFCSRGFGEVEIHLHHRNDTPEGLRKKLAQFRDLLRERHGLLGGVSDHRPQTAGSSPTLENENGREPQVLRSEVCGLKSMVSSTPSYGFIHGNWALCNSRPDGDWCGVNEELGILAETGCYADFTFPSAPSPTQPRMVNAVYYAQDVPGGPRGADRGKRVSVINERLSAVGYRLGKKANSQEPITNNGAEGALMLITGPLALNWLRRKWGILPRMENSEISGANPPNADRVRVWVQQAIGVAGRPEWVFVKLHTHGCVPGNTKVLLGKPMRAMHETLHREFNDGSKWQLHYVTAREMYNLVKAAEAAKPGPPGQWRDWLVDKPPICSTHHPSHICHAPC